MDSKALLRASVGSMMLLSLAIIISVIFGEPARKTSDVAVAAPVTPTPAVTAVISDVQDEPGVLESYLGTMGRGELEELPDRCIIIRKEFTGKDAALTLSPSYIDRSITLLIEGGSRPGRYDRSVIRVCGENIWDGEPDDLEDYKARLAAEQEAAPETGKSDDGYMGSDYDEKEDAGFEPEGGGYPLPLEFNDYGRLTEEASDSDFVLAMGIAESEQGTEITLLLSNSYEYYCHEDENYYYICCVDPKSIYDRIVVIDAGHGGGDPGTTVAGNENLEKDFNLDIVLRLKELLDDDPDIHAYYTRTTDRYPTLDQRVGLANDMGADMFLSVHCNSAKSSYIGGTEVLYNQYQNGWDAFNSKRLAKICMECVNERYPLMNRGIIPRAEDVLIIEYAQMPVALLEVAYLSNSSNLRSIKNEENRQAVALGLYDTIKKAYEEIGDK